MGKTIKLIQANLEHAKAASYTISKRFVNELLDVALKTPDLCSEDVLAPLTVSTEEEQLELFSAQPLPEIIGAENNPTLV
ncbi:hypothetical protein JTB14_026035 [Gonioctena quinquepunctata]|nr:hypothetical protein JTB14_026035 [Gonioctena quinquepunctata]